jgi:hypothetical protein
MASASASASASAAAKMGQRKKKEENHNRLSEVPEHPPLSSSDGYKVETCTSDTPFMCSPT